MRKTLEGAGPGAMDKAERASRLAREASQAKAEHEAMVRSVDDRTARLKAMRLERDRISDEAAAAAAAAAPPRKRRAKAK